MSNADFKELLNRYLTDSLSVEELHELLAHLQKQENTEALRAAIQQALTENAFKGLSDKSRTDVIFNKIMQQARDEEAAAGVTSMAAPSVTSMAAPGVTSMAAGDVTSMAPHSFRLWRRMAWAAAFLALIAGAYLLKNPPAKSIVSVSKLPPASNDVAPGRNKAILQLADSTSIVLDDSDTGMLAQQGTTKILKLNNGQLTYHSAAGNDHRDAPSDSQHDGEGPSRRQGTGKVHFPPAGTGFCDSDGLV